MPKEEELKFGDRLICRREIKANGRLYLPGMDFPYKTMAMVFKKVKSLFAMGKLVRAADLSLDDIKKLKDISKNRPVEVPPETTGEETPPDDPGEGDEKETEIEIKEVSTGWYDVLVNGEKVNDKSLRKRQAMKLAEEYEGE